MGRAIQDDLAELLALARNGSGKACEQLVHRFQRGVMRVAMAMTGNPDDAQDVAQEVFLRFFRSLDSIDAQRGPAAWLRKVAVRASLDHLSRYRSADQGQGPFSPDQLAGPVPELGDAALERALKELTARERGAFLLVYLFGYSTVESGEAMNCTAGTVKTLCFRARHKLRALLAKEWT